MEKTFFDYLINNNNNICRKDFMMYLPNDPHLNEETLNYEALHPLKNIINEIEKNFKMKYNEMAVAEIKSIHYIRKVIRDIVPFNFTGCSHNLKKMCYMIRRIIYAAKAEFVPLKNLIDGWYLHKITWCSEENKPIILMLALEYFYENILKKQILKLLFHNIRTSSEIYQIPTKIYQRWSDRVYFKLKSEHVILPKLNETVVDGTIKFHTKSTNTFRPIFQYHVRSDKEHQNEKKKFKEIGNVLRKRCQNLFSENNFFQVWQNYVAIHKNKDLYAVKIDVKDCYGGIDTYLLKNKVEENFKPYIELPQEKENLEQVLDCINFQNIELRRDKNARRKTVKRKWSWSKGLLQGAWLSSSLCHLYRDNFDNKYLIQFYNKPGVFLNRYVDDYFFASTNKEDAEEFLDIMTNHEEINETKIVTNLENNVFHIPYKGFIINLLNKNIELYVDPKVNLRCRSLIYDKRVNTDKEYFRKLLDYRFNSNRFNYMFTNCTVNNKKTAVFNIFTAFILLAYKLVIGVKIRFNREKLEGKREKLVLKTIKDTVRVFVARITNQYEKNAITSKRKGKVFIGRMTLFMVGYQAFILVLKRRSNYFKNILKKLIELRRENSNYNANKYYHDLNLKSLPPKLKLDLTGKKTNNFLRWNLKKTHRRQRRWHCNKYYYKGVKGRILRRENLNIKIMKY